ncbi:MAG: DUF4411 family protein [Rhodothermaceae bacterium]|nr:DUF4411 family protein [Rhodothermaceae bacterium]MYG43723.1 DUF4411 family protein [Rhodothermaceae bacterium]MYK62915.1 DUF4411 family protein [Rhodothermaceae bacterium]
MQGNFFLIDSDALITAHRRYYSFDICPGFWNNLLRCHKEERIFSINRVRQELLQGNDTDELLQWVKNELPCSFFLEENSTEVILAYKRIVNWAQDHPTYSDQAQAIFASSADAWLVAFAHVHDAILVTNEKSAPLSKNIVKIPDACKQFNVGHMDTFSMLRSLRVAFN